MPDDLQAEKLGSSRHWVAKSMGRAHRWFGVLCWLRSRWSGILLLLAGIARRGRGCAGRGPLEFHLVGGAGTHVLHNDAYV